MTGPTTPQIPATAPKRYPVDDTRPAPEAESSESGFNPIAVFYRRWPLLAVGLAIGGVIAAFIHLTAVPAYQSSAQVSVSKKRTDVVQVNDARVAVLEDYVAVQVTLIKSESIRKAAAIELRKHKLNQPLPQTDDNRAAAGSLLGGLQVSRDKDSSAAGGGGSGVLLLSYRGGDSADTRVILEAIIKAYTDALYAKSDQATSDKIVTLNKTLDVIQKDRQKAAEEKYKLQAELRKITPEDVLAIRTRVTSLKDKLYTLQLDLTEVSEQLKLIADAGTDPASRRVVLAQLTAQTKFEPTGSTVNPASPGTDQAVRALEAQRAELSNVLGKDHERMKALDAQITYLKDELRRRNPAGKPDTLDDLGAYELRAELKKRTTGIQIKQLTDGLKDDEDKLQKVGGLQNQIEALADRVQQFDRDIARLEGDLSSTKATVGSGGYTAEQITPPADGGRVAPVLFTSILTGLMIGLVLGVGAIALAEWTDRSFRSPADIRRRLGLAVIGHIPSIRAKLKADPTAPDGLDPMLVAAVRPKSIEAEAYRGVRTQLYFSTQGQGHTVIQVTSPNPGDGKSTLAANLAISIAQSGKRVVLVDCDMRKPRVHALFKIAKGAIGLAGVITGKLPTGQAIQRSAIENLDLLPCGPRPANPAELLTSPELPRVLTELRAAYDFVVVDTPPLLAVSDPTVVAPRADGVILVFRMTKAARPAAERAREQLAAIGANCLGVVVNGYTDVSSGYASYSYGAGGGYRYADYQYADQYAYGDRTAADDES